MAAERFANNFETALAAAIDSSQTSITTVTPAPTSLQNGQFRVIIGSEVCLVTAGQSGTTWTVQRGAELTAGAAHAAGSSLTHVITAHSVQIRNEELWVTDPRVGITTNLTGVDQGPQIQAGILLAQTGDGVLSFPPGKIENRSVEFTYSSATDQVFLKGTFAAEDERAGSVIHYPADFGPGKYAVKLLSIDALPITWSDIHFHGPGGFPGYGNDHSLMWGPRVTGRCRLERVTISGFKTGLFAAGDHLKLIDCSFTGNSYNLYLADNQNWGIGDVRVIGTFLTGASKASIGVGSSYALASFKFEGGHAGFAPIGIHRFLETGQPVYRNTWMLGGAFENFGFEGCGDAVILDDTTDGSIADITFTNPGEAGEASFHWSGKTARGLWDVSAVDRIYMRGDVSPWVQVSPAIDKPWIYSTSRITNLRCDNAEYAGAVAWSDSGHKLLTSPYIEKALLGFPGATGQGFSARVVNVSENVSRYDALELTETGQARKARNVYPYLGQAMHDATTGTSVMVCVDGRVSIDVQAHLTATVAVGDGLIVDSATPGSLKKQTAFGFDTVARASAAITPGNTGTVLVTHSQAG